MSHIESGLRTAFDHHSPEFAASWRDDLRAMRERCPVSNTRTHGGFVVVTKYDDVQRVLRNAKTFASARDLEGGGWASAGGVTIPTNLGRMGFMEMDPPESVAYRRLVNPWLSRAAVQPYRPRIAEIATWCIDRFAESGTVEVVRDVASPVPALVTLDVLGLDLACWTQYAEAAHGAVFREPGSGQKLKWMMQDVQAVVRGGRHTPDGLVASWKAASVAGAPLSDDMVCELIYMMINGGVDTTTSLIANAVVELDDQPDTRRRMAEEPHLIPAVVQELLRYCVPSTGVARTAIVDTEIGGVPIAAGTRLLLVLASANFDAEHFESPDSLDVDRHPNLHLSFGTGAHRCVGAELAAAEAEVLLAELVRRLPDLRVERDQVRRYPRMPLVNGYTAVPATFTPAPRACARTDLPALTRPRLQPEGQPTHR